jgi:hypothetical protein
VFPAGKQLPHLRNLSLDRVCHPAGPAAAPEGTRLASCCPGLQELGLQALHLSRGLVASLQGLSSMTALGLRPAPGSEGLEEVCQLTGLQQLDLQEEPGTTQDSLLQLTQLRQLTLLTYGAWPAGEDWPRYHCFQKVGKGP